MSILLITIVLALVIPFLVQVVKTLWKKIPDKVVPFLPIIIGIGGGLLTLIFTGWGIALREAILIGLASGGLSASLYDIWSALTAKKA